MFCSAPSKIIYSCNDLMSPSKYIIVYSKPFETCFRYIQVDQLTREGMTNIINDPLDRGHIELLHLRVGKRS